MFGGTLGGTYSYGYGINASGQVTGYALTSGNSAQHAFLYSGGSMQDLGTLGGIASYGYGINASGQVTGAAYTTSNTIQHAFLYSGGSMRDLGTLGGTNSGGFGINTSGQVVGSSDITGNSTSHAFLYSAGSMVDLNTLNHSGSSLFLNDAETIDDLGIIAGYASDQTQTTNAALAFVAIPRFGGAAQPARTEAVPRVAMPDSLRTLVQQKIRTRGARRIGPAFGDSQK